MVLARSMPMVRMNRSIRCFWVGDPMATYDFTWMWDELGLIDLRR